MEPVSFQHYICSLDFNSLPRVVKICSGVYFQGSVYELFGNECCLSNGDLMKIVNIQLQDLKCKDVKSGHVYPLPLNFKGLFKLGSEPPEGKQQKPMVPAFLSSKESPQQKLYTLQEVLQSATMRRKRLKCTEMSKNDLELCPVYKVEAIMHFRNDVVTVNSTLDIEIVDVTAESQHIHFIKPLLLSEVLAMEKAMPMEVEILGAPEGSPIFQSDWFSYLHRGTRIHIHSKGMSWKILASSRKGKARSSHFLISSNYKGGFRRSPRTFSSTSELVPALATSKTLHVVVTKDDESSDGECSLFGVGDRLEVRRLARATDASTADTLVCCRDNGDEDWEEIQVPLFLEAGFVEDIRDSRKYTITEVAELFHFPCEVKTIHGDSALDPLSGFSALTLEAQIKEPFLTASLAEERKHSFEIPPQWVDMSVFFTGRPAKSMPFADPACVEELSEVFYYQLVKQLPSHVPAPPRPPKKTDSRRDKQPLNGAEMKTRVEHSKFQHNSSPDSGKLPLPGLQQKNTGNITTASPNLYIAKCQHPRLQEATKSCKQTKGVAFDEDSDHEYEEVDATKEIIHKLGRAFTKH